MGSLGLMLRAGRRTPLLLLVLFVGWVLLPFVALAWATTAAKRWSPPTRTTLHTAIWVVALGSLAVYGYAVIRPRQSTPAATFLLVPLASWALMAIAIGTAALRSRQSKAES